MESNKGMGNNNTQLGEIPLNLRDVAEKAQTILCKSNAVVSKLENIRFIISGKETINDPETSKSPTVCGTLNVMNKLSNESLDTLNMAYSLLEEIADLIGETID